jgi:hypothetical protein
VLSAHLIIKYRNLGARNPGYTSVGNWPIGKGFPNGEGPQLASDGTRESLSCEIEPSRERLNL